MRLGKRAYSVVVFLLVSVVGGGLAAGFVIPAVGAVSASGRDAAVGMSALPQSLPVIEQPERSKVLMADGSLLTYFYDQNRLYVPLDKISETMKAAQVAIEDHRFYLHGAIDVTGTMRALVSTSQGVTQGGSSITQQYVRLALLEKARADNDEAARRAATENSLSRKINELRLATGLEQEHTKDWILEHYLNISYYGDGAYGVEAAARHYFGVAAKDLNLPQSAMLAGLVRNPVATNPVKFQAVAIERRNNVIDRMVEIGKATPEEGAAAKATPFDPSKVTEQKLDCANSRFPFICDYAKRVLTGDGSPLVGASYGERKADLFEGGYTIKLTIDPDIQKQSEKTIANWVDPRDPVVSVISMQRPSTGEIVAMAQSRTVMGDNLDAKNKKKWEGETYYNYAVTHEMGGSDGFQGGSTFKAFVAAAALKAGMGAYGQFNAEKRMKLTGPFKSCDGPFTYPQSQAWPVTNSSRSGWMDMFAGVKNSVNTYFAQLIGAVGGCASVNMANDLGLKLGKPSERYKSILSYDNIPAVTLGSAEISPMSLVNAYSTFANRGVRCEPIILASIKTRTGASLDVPDGNCRRVIPQDVADAINKIFQGPYNGGTASAAKIPGVQMAGKTGTVPDNKAVWTVGYTPGLAAAAMYSYDNDPQFSKFWDARHGRYLNGAYLEHSKHYVHGASGSEAGGRLLRPSFAYAISHLAHYDDSRFKEPPSSVLNGEWQGVPSCAGASVDSCKSLLRDAGFTAAVKNVDADSPKGTLVGTDPSGKAPKLSSIAILVSKGPKKGSPAWCQIPGNGADPSCVSNPVPLCADGFVWVPNPPPSTEGTCQPQ